jgi:hypothetical protein
LQKNNLIIDIPEYFYQVYNIMTQINIAKVSSWRKKTETNNTETTRYINNDSLELFVERSESLTPNSFNVEWLIDRLVEEK